jgi:hypothetical protein
MPDIPFREPGRRTPAKGVHISIGGPNWVFLTVGTEKRERWLAQVSVQRALHELWEHKATAWLVSDYLVSGRKRVFLGSVAGAELSGPVAKISFSRLTGSQRPMSPTMGTRLLSN